MPDSILTGTLPERVSASVAKARAYLRSRQSAEGGFCFYRYEDVDEPNLRDTYHGVLALKLLAEPVPDLDKLLRFLDGARLFGLGYLYWYAFTLDLIGLASRIDAQRMAWIRGLDVELLLEGARPGERRAWLEDTRRKVRLKTRFAQPWTSERLMECLPAQRTEGGYGDRPNLWDTLSSLTILDCLGCRKEMQASVPFVERMQVLPFGFSLTEGSRMPNLEVVRAGCRCCALLGLPIRHRIEVLELAVACQTADGGFSRTPTALPNIDLTYQALQVFGLAARDGVLPGRTGMEGATGQRDRLGLRGSGAG